MSARCVVVGAGHGAAQLCASLRSLGWEGGITLIGDEPALPYHRPPLTKTQLDPATSADPQLIRPDAFYASKDILVLSGTRVDAIDRAGKFVRAGSLEIPYDKLVLCTGSVPCRPPIAGMDHEKVFRLRTAAECRALRDRVRSGARAAIIGGGFIGLEVAASLRKQDVEVTLLQSAPRVLSRVCSPEVSAFFERLHRERAVDVHCGVQVEEIAPREGGLEVRCSNGLSYAVDFVVVGVGSVPSCDLAENAGLTVDKGIAVNDCNQTSDPDIYALGDCCNQFHPVYGRRIRLESVQNAVEQARTVAASLTGHPVPHDAIPWFWSDQYEVKLQIAGLSEGYDQMVIRGSAEPGHSFSAWHYADGRLRAVDAVNDSAAYAVALKLLKAGRSPDPVRVGDSSLPIKELLKNEKETSHD